MLFPRPRDGFREAGTYEPPAHYREAMRPLYWFLISIALLAIGVSLILVRTFGPEPEFTCVEEGQPTSGYSITVDGQECALSVEDFEKVWQYQNRSALPIRWTGLGVFAVGLGTGVTGIVSAVRRRKRTTA